MKTVSPSITVIIVNFNSGLYLLNCLRALEKQTKQADVIVIDNASQDDSARIAHNEFPEISFLPLRYNVGFSRAVNIGVTRSTGEHFVLLNPDTLPDQQFVEKIVEPFSTHAQIASVAGTLVFFSQPRIIASSGISFHRNGVAIDRRIGETFSSNMDKELVFGASGGAAAFRRSAFVEAGGLPEHYFMYLEDADLAWRFQLAGWKSVWSPEAVARHAYSASAGEGSPFKRRLLARNRIWTLVRCIPGEILRKASGDILLHDSAATGYAAWKRNWPTLYGRAEAFARIAPRLCERRSIQRSRTVSITHLEALLDPPISASQLLNIQQLTKKHATAVQPGI